jgi:hypothetical protein
MLNSPALKANAPVLRKTGYLEFHKALNDPNHEDHQSYMEWSGGDYVPDSFDVDVVNWELMQYRRWSRDREQKWENIG